MMAAHPPAAAPKLFREEAQTGAVACPACGGPITLKGFGGVEQVSCPYCGSELSPEDSGSLNILQQAQRQRQRSVLPLHIRGVVDGIECELIGIVWREVEVDGVVYPWQEFLLFNPYRGYRWLVFQMTDGQWTLGGALDGAPELTQKLGHRAVTFKKAKYKHFQTAVARTTYVEGEFPWQVRVGDQAVAHDYVNPPQCVSIEEVHSDEGQDVNFTHMKYLDGAEVWAAFGLDGQPPRTSGVGMVQPNPWKKGRWMTLVSALVLVGLWLVVTIAYASARANKTLLSKKGVALASMTAEKPLTQEIEIGKKGKSTTVEVRFEAGPLSNAWAYAEVMLVSADGDGKEADAIGIGLTAEEWHGVSGGEAWREGSTVDTKVIGGVPGGKYLVQIATQAGTQSSKVPPAGLIANIRIKEDVVLVRYIALSGVIIIVIPIFYLLLAGVYEGRRWANSDYAQQSQ